MGGGGGEHMVERRRGHMVGEGDMCERRRGHMVWEEEGNIWCERRKGTYGVRGGGGHMV